jgi:hypothetical protein
LVFSSLFVFLFCGGGAKSACDGGADGGGTPHPQNSVDQEEL